MRSRVSLPLRLARLGHGRLSRWAMIGLGATVPQVQSAAECNRARASAACDERAKLLNWLKRLFVIELDHGSLEFAALRAGIYAAASSQREIWEMIMSQYRSAPAAARRRPVPDRRRHRDHADLPRRPRAALLRGLPPAAGRARAARRCARYFARYAAIATRQRHRLHPGEPDLARQRRLGRQARLLASGAGRRPTRASIALMQRAAHRVSRAPARRWWSAAASARAATATIRAR